AGPAQPRHAGLAAPGDSTTSRPGNRGPRSGGWSPGGSAGRVRPFFRAYAGSGLVSQCLARFQPTPRRFKVARIVSLLTGSAVKPCSKLTLAAHARAHRLVGWLNVRGLWLNRAR